MERLNLFREVVEDYRNQFHVRGTRDCNLMVLKVFDPVAHEHMKGSYNTIMGGVKASLKYKKVRSIREYLITLGFREVEKGYEQPLDVIVFLDKHDVYISNGSYWFGVNHDEKFNFVIPKIGSDYLVYREVK